MHNSVLENESLNLHMDGNVKQHFVTHMQWRFEIKKVLLTIYDLGDDQYGLKQ